MHFDASIIGLDVGLRPQDQINGTIRTENGSSSKSKFCITTNYVKKFLLPDSQTLFKITSVCGADRSSWYSLTALHFQLACPPVSRSSVRLVVGCLTSHQHASVSQGRICTDIFTCFHNEIEVADQTLHLTQSQYTDTGPTSPSADPIMPGAWQGSHWSANF